MYVIRKDKKKANYPDTNYTFKDFKGFYEIAEYLDVPVFGKYSILIKSENVEQILSFIDIEETFAEFVVYIYTTQAVIDYVTLRKPAVKVDDTSSMYNTYKELIEKHGVLFSKGVDDLLYRSVEHDYEEMDSVLLKLKLEFDDVEITSKMLQTVVVVDDIVYPREVLNAYLRLDRWRLQKLRKCVKQVGNDVCYWVIKRTLRSMIKSKTKYLQTGVSDSGIRYINSTNLLMMYRLFVTGTGYVSDVELLMRLYERGLTVYDIIQEDSISI